jgi:CBS domain-containing protein
MTGPTATVVPARREAPEPRPVPGLRSSECEVERGPAISVADAMITEVKLSARGTTVGELRGVFRNEHIHAAMIVEDGVLLAVVDRIDLEGAARDDDAALPLGGLRSRTIGPGVDLEQARQLMLTTGRRRLAVVGADRRLRGLLCLKRTRRGFCSDRDVRARSDERRSGSTPRA